MNDKDNLDIHPFDNNLNILLKFGKLFSTPVKFLLIFSEDFIELNYTEYKKNNFTVKTLISVIKLLIADGNSFSDIQGLFTDFYIPDIAIIYYSFFRDKSLLIKSTIFSEINLTLVNKRDVQSYNNINDLENSYEIWKTDFDNTTIKENKKIDNIIEIQKQLLNFKPLKNRKFVNNEYTFNAFITKNDGSKIRYDDGIKIFNNATLSNNIPYINFIDDNIKVFKILKTDDIIPVDKIILGDTEKQNIIFFRFWDEQTALLEKATEKSLLEGTIDLKDKDKKIVTIKKLTPKSLDENKIKNIIETQLQLKIYNTFKSKIEGEFLIFDIKIDEKIFVYTIMTDRILKNYLYINESNDTIIDNKLTYYFRISEREGDETKGIKFKINNREANKGEIFNYEDNNFYEQPLDSGKEEKMEIKNKLYYLSIRVLDASSDNEIVIFIQTISRLLSYYKDIEDETIEVIKEILPDISEKISRKKEKKDALKKKKSGADLLKLKYREIFVSGYARLCNNKPEEVIDDNILEEWNKDTFENSYKKYDNKILPFPKASEENPKFFFKCPKETPFPGVIKNSKSNKAKYPYLPCCFPNDQFEKKNSNTQSYYLDREKDDSEARKTHINDSDKVLVSGKLGFANNGIQELLLLGFNEEEKSNLVSNEKNRIFMREYSINFPSSLLYAILESTKKDPKYLEKPRTDIEKEIYIINLRKKIAEVKDLNVLKQENYDKSLEQIKEELADGETFLDPAIFYRIFEEIYKINIYVFIKKIDKSGKEIIELEVPKHKLFHARIYRENRPVLIIYKNKEIEPGKFKFPQCEYIFYREKNNRVPLFSENINRLLYDCIKQTNRTLIIYPDKIREDIFSLIDYVKLFGCEIKYQLIDKYGKMKAIILESDYNGKMVKITIFIPPTQPLFLEVSKEIFYSDYETIFNLFDKPNTFTMRRENNEYYIDGLWYKVLDIEIGFFIPIIPVKFAVSSKGTSFSPIIRYNSNNKRLNKLNFQLNIIYQLLNWLLVISKLHYEEFINNHFIVTDFKSSSKDTIDSANIYEFNLENSLPKNAKKLSKAFKYLEENTKNFVSGEKILLYSEKFKKGLSYFVKQVYTRNNMKQIKIDEKGNTPDVHNRVLKGLFIDENNFIKQRNSILFLSRNNLLEWKDFYIKTNNEENITLQKLPQDLWKRRETIFYFFKNNFFIIQNVQNGDLKNAIYVSKIWSNKKINLGYDTVSLTEIDKEPYILYNISIYEELAIEKNSIKLDNEEDQFATIINYGENRYGALLKVN